MSVMQTFNPAYGCGVTVSPGVASGSSVLGKGNKTICLTNIGTVVCYIRTGASAAGAVTATAADYPVPTGGQVTITKFEDHDTVAYIGAAGGSLHIMPGEGW